MPFIFVSGVIGEDNAVEMLKRGATDYVSKGRLVRLPLVIDRALREVSQREAREAAQVQLREPNAVFARVVVIWVALLVPIGVYAGLKRDVALTCLLAAHAVVTIGIVAVASGNIGTLIRHRSLALPYIVWISAAGALECVRQVVSRRAGRRAPRG